MVRLVVLLLLTALVACLAFSIPEVAHHRSLSSEVGKHNRLLASALSTGLKCVVEVDAYPDGERLLYADDDLLVYDKPPNVLSVPGLRDKTSLVESVAQRFKMDRVDQMVVHRLDYATSGVIVFARHVAALKALHTQFRRKEVHKLYKAVVCVGAGAAGARLPALAGEVTLPILRDAARGRPFMCVRDPDGIGKPSLTVWRADSVSSVGNSGSGSDSDNGLSLALLSMQPRTGRTHQLRVHAAAVGLPMLGDAFYAPPHVADLAPRLLLHAERISFMHPFTGLPLVVTAPCPFRLR
jgi:tRNA pseudouridine32 synthase/23S rRNA pseudouridine746 synthase